MKNTTRKEIKSKEEKPELLLLEKISLSCQKILKENMVGIYVHGSLAFQCFHWKTNDIDFLIVVRQDLSLKEKKDMIKALLALDSESPPGGLEMSIVPKSVCKKFQYPTPFYLHYSKMHRERCIADLDSYCKNMNGTDPDLAAHFTVTKSKGICLYGEDIQKVFSPVPEEYYLDSIKRDVLDSLKYIEENPVYLVLNMCRILAYQEERIILSKEQGGKWALKNIPQKYHPVITKALSSYTSGLSFHADKNSFLCFVEYMNTRFKWPSTL